MTERQARSLILGLGFFVAAGAASAATPPLAVSPGEASRLAAVEARCPTFSWSAVEGASGYELVVYRLSAEGKEPPNAEAPVLRQSFSGSVTGWTPSLGQCLERGGRYAWSVRGTDEVRTRHGEPSDNTTTDWSAPSFFEVAAGPSPTELEDALAVVRSYLSAGDGAGGSGASDREPSDKNSAAATSSPEYSPPAAGMVAAAELTVDGGVVAGSFTGDGSTLTSLEPANLAAGTAAIDISGNAATATSATSAASATSADHATTADSAATADTAAVATSAGTATMAGHATTSDSATTATTANTAAALAADGSDCPTGKVPLGVDEAGNAQGCGPAVAAVSCPPGTLLFGFDVDGTPACASFASPGIRGAISAVDTVGQVGSNNSITMAADGLPVVSYIDQTNEYLKVAKCNDPACDPAVNGPETISAVDFTGTFNSTTSIALGADGLPVVSYFDATNKNLMVAKCNDPACDPTVNGPETISAIDTAGFVGVFSSIALGTDGLPVVSYYDQTNLDLKVAKCNDPACDPTVNGPETISAVDTGGDVGYGTSIALGADGLPVVSYYDRTNLDLKVAKCNDPACDPTVNGPETISAVDTAGDVGYGTSIALAADGLPVVSYFDTTNQNLKVAKCNDPACDPTVNGPETISAVDTAGNVGYGTSIALGADGLPVVSYFDTTNQNLKVAKCNDPACDPTVNGPEIISAVDTAGDVGVFNSIALGTDGLPVVSYYDGTNGDLKVAKINNPAFLLAGDADTEAELEALLTDVTNILTDSETAATAFALAADGANCPANQFAMGVDVAGAAQGCAVPPQAQALSADGANCPAGQWASGVNESGAAQGCTQDAAGIHHGVGIRNVTVGPTSLVSLTTGEDNTATGVDTLYSLSSGSRNSAFGKAALANIDTTDDNTALGYFALANATGTGNLALGKSAGASVTTGSNNILIANGGVSTESNTTRIGSSGVHNRTLVSGIRGVTTGTADAIQVLIDSNGQLGTASSSLATKQDIADIGTDSERLSQLRPVRFRYKQHAAQGDPTIQFGLIAEEVAEIFPELVVYDEEGNPVTVKYHLLSSLLLNELQRLADRLEALEAGTTR